MRRLCVYMVCVLAGLGMTACQAAVPGAASGGSAGTMEGRRLYALTLASLLPAGEGRRDVQVYAVHDGKRWVRAMASSPEWNRAGHLVEMAGVRVSGGRLEGTLELLIEPDQWLPESGEPWPVTVTVTLRQRLSTFVGAYEARVAGERVEGAVRGEVGSIEERDGPAVVWFRVEGPWAGGHSWQRWMGVKLWVEGDVVKRAWAQWPMGGGGRWESVDPAGFERSGEGWRGAVSHEDRRGGYRVGFEVQPVGHKAVAVCECTYERGERTSTVRRVARGGVRRPTVPERAGLVTTEAAFPDWAQGIAWERTVDITSVEGANWDERLGRAQEQLGEAGGVVYLPAGEYAFADDIRLMDGVVLRGAEPGGVLDARDERYELGTRVVFPRYEPVFEGEGTPVGEAFKGIRLADPVGGERCGVMHVHIENGNVHFGHAWRYRRAVAAGEAGGKWLVYGCIVRNAATAAGSIPKPFQHGWQRFTHRKRAAIQMWTGGDVWIANNRIPASGEANFVMKGYRLYTDRPATHEQVKSEETTEVGVEFDYDNRPGIAVNDDALGKGLQIWQDWRKITDPRREDSGTDMPPAFGVVKGIRIENNYVYCTGCAAIRTSGDGTYVGHNVIRYARGVVRPTADGMTLSNFTNDNRAIEVRGWRWTVEGNDYEVYSNYGLTGTKYNDGEGIMHEAWENVGIRDSVIRNNRGNAYICIWRAPVRGLLIEGNHVRTGGIADIFVLGQTNKDVDLPCERVRIIGNTTEGTGIKVVGQPGVGNEIRNNRHVRTTAPGRIENHVFAEESGNEGYE